MHDVTDQLRNWSTSLAESVPPTDIEAITSPLVTTAGPRAAGRWLAVAASTILVVGGTFAIATLGDAESDTSNRSNTATNPTAVDTDTDAATVTTEASIPTSSADTEPVPPSSTAASAIVPPTVANPDDRLAGWPAPPAGPTSIEEIPRLLPTSTIPATGVPVRAEAPGGGTAAPPTFTQVFVDADRDMLITLQTQPGGADSTPAAMRQPVTIEGWDDAFVTEGGLSLVASDPSGFVRLAGSGIEPGEAVSIVASMQRRVDGVPGWDLAGDDSGVVEINGAWNDSAAQRFVSWFEGDRLVAEMLTSPAHTDLISQALGTSFEKVDVGGADAWFTSTGDRRAIVWSPDGATIVVLGVVGDNIDPLAVARSVVELGVAEYESATTTEIPAGVGDGCDGSLFC